MRKIFNLEKVFLTRIPANIYNECHLWNDDWRKTNDLLSHSKNERIPFENYKIRKITMLQYHILLLQHLRLTTIDKHWKKFPFWEVLRKFSNWNEWFQDLQHIFPVLAENFVLWGVVPPKSIGIIVTTPSTR